MFKVKSEEQNDRREQRKMMNLELEEIRIKRESAQKTLDKLNARDIQQYEVLGHYCS